MKIKFSEKLKAIATITLILLMASVTTTITMPVQAQTVLPSNVTPTNVQSGASIPLPAGVIPGYTVTPNVFLSASPSPIGVGQTLLVNMWMQPPVFAGRYFTGYTVTITLPGGTNVTEGPYNSYPGDTTAYFSYTVEQVGIYKLQFNFPGGYFPTGNYSVASGTFIGQSVDSFTQSVYYQPATSPVTDIVVQSAQVASWPTSPLPTEYWTQPVSPNNRDWWTIAGWYPNTGVVGGVSSNGENPWPANTNPYMSNYNYIPYVQAPTSAHVLWDVQAAMSGLIGSDQGDLSLQNGGGNPSIVYDGRCYETLTTVLNGVPQQIWECYNLQTGQIYWEQPVPTYTTQTVFGPTVAPPASAPNMVVIYSKASGSSTEEVTSVNAAPSLTVSLLYVGNSRWMTFDPFSGAVTANVSIAPLTTGTEFMNNYFLSVQNIGTGANPNYRLINWTVGGVVGAGSAGYAVNYALEVMSNITWPWSSLPATTDYQAGISALVTGITSTATGGGNATNIQAASLTTGALLWNTTVPYMNFIGQCNCADQGKIAVLFEGPGYMAWNLATGTLAWTGEQMDYPWGSSSFGAYAVQSAYGLLYRESYNGVYAFNWTNGQIAWHFAAPATPFETPYTFNGTSVYSFNAGGIVADGQLYTYTTEHTPSQPITRGWSLYDINATTGQDIWNITGELTPGAISGGYLTASNANDGYMYVFGKGESATTIQAPLTAITEGQSVVLTGTVLDQSPGQPGTPCVSAASMTQWMEYLHMQKPIPANVTGVPVSIDTLDPNGNLVHIATVTSDITGSYNYLWQPQVPGKYTVTATFTGDDSYGSSYAETAIGVVGASPTQTPTATPPQTIADMYFIPAIAGIIVAIAIVGAALALLMLRKRPTVAPIA
jgi:hypothetical protein